MEEENNTKQVGEAMGPNEVTVPLTDGEKQIPFDVKCDADIEEAVPASEGLTKDELMKFAKDPFWVRIRIVFMVAFWLGWAAMLAMAVVIIVQAPRCPPPPSSTWLQESAIVMVDVDTPPANATSLLAEAGLSSLYIADLMDATDYADINKDYNKDTVIALLQAVTFAGLKVVTDFTPSVPALLLPFVNATDEDAYSTGKLSEQHLGGLESLFEQWKDTYNVTGFLVDSAAAKLNPNLFNVTQQLNLALNSQDIAFGDHAIDLQTLMPSSTNFKPFKAELAKKNWNYFKASVPKKTRDMSALLLGLMSLPGTPLLMQTPGMDGVSFLGSVVDQLSPITLEAVDLRTKDSILYGLAQYANTSDHVLAFTRTLKGTPGYAVAVNTHISDTAVVKFSSLAHIPTKGNLVFNTSDVKAKGRNMDLEKVEVGPNTGLLVQFVAMYD